MITHEAVTAKYVMRYHEILEEAVRWSEIYWFWYRPSTKTLVPVEGTHTGVAAYELGVMEPPEGEIDLEDESIIQTAIDAGWVRGRYGQRGPSPYSPGSMSWDSQEEVGRGGKFDLSLQGDRDTVLASAREICRRRRVHDLFVDFGTGANMESICLSGAEKEHYLETGSL